MNLDLDIDINTLAFVFSLLSFMQVVALFVQYRLDRTYPGLGWWTLGNTFWALGSIFNCLRAVPSLTTIAIIANNILFLNALVLLYVGVLRFLGRHESRGWLAVFCAGIILVS
jgi:hypothetical protein